MGLVLRFVEKIPSIMRIIYTCFMLKKLYIIDIINLIDKLAIVVVILRRILDRRVVLDGRIIRLEVIGVVVCLVRDKVGIYGSFDIIRDLGILYRLRFRLVEIILRFRKFKSRDIRKIRIDKRR